MRQNRGAETLRPVPRDPPWHSAQSLLLEMIGYAIVSAFALGVDATLLWVLATSAGWNYMLASITSFMAGAIVAYILSIHFVFRFRQVNSRTLEFGFFVVIGLVGLVVNTIALTIAVGGMGLGLLAGKALAAIVTFLTNFLLRRRLLFMPTRTAK